MNTFTLNGNRIVAKEFDFNLLCDLDDMGISIQDAGKKPLSFVRAYVAICMNIDLSTAGYEIQEHMKNDTLDAIFEVMNKEIDESDFFRNQQSTDNQTEITEKKSKTSKNIKATEK